MGGARPAGWRPRCGPQTAAGRAGCSQETGATVFQAAETDCNGFSLPAIIRSAVICAEQAGGPWTCTDTLDSATHRPGDATQGGVLCCKD